MGKPKTNDNTGDGSPLTATPGSRSDTERLKFLLRFIEIADVGDEYYVAGVIVDWEGIEEATGRAGVIPDEDIRVTLDRAINHFENDQAEGLR